MILRRRGGDLWMVSTRCCDRRMLLRYVHTFFIRDHSRCWGPHTSLILEPAHHRSSRDWVLSTQSSFVSYPFTPVVWTLADVFGNGVTLEVVRFMFGSAGGTTGTDGTMGTVEKKKGWQNWFLTWQFRSRDHLRPITDCGFKIFNLSFVFDVFTRT